MNGGSSQHKTVLLKVTFSFFLYDLGVGGGGIPLSGCLSRHPGGPLQSLFQHCIPLFCIVFISVVENIRNMLYAHGIFSQLTRKLIFRLIIAFPRSPHVLEEFLS